VPGGGRGKGELKVLKIPKKDIKVKLSIKKIEQITKKYNWVNQQSLYRHFSKHSTDFGVKTIGEYAQMASNFFQKSKIEKFSTKIDPDGIIRVYDPKTNTLGVFGPDEKTRSFFKPIEGRAYWDRQRGTLR
jgi:pyocin large subunit-like protein